MSDPTSLAPQRLTAAEVLTRAAEAARAGRSGEAEALYRGMLAAGPLPAASANLGTLLEANGRYDEAEAVYRQALARDPEDVPAKRLLGLLLLRNGAWDEAWPLYDSRPLPQPPAVSYPAWRGEDIKSLLILPEPGLSEQIQYARYASLLSGRGGRITLVCHPVLSRLFEPLGVCLIPSQGEASIPHHDAWIFAGSLPRLFKTTPQTIPPAPYLPRRLGGRGVGLATLGERPEASLPAEAAAALDPAGEMVSLNPRDLAARDMAAIAERIAGLELVIAVDSPVAHVAGAMGKPCWLLAPYHPDWRWMRDRPDSPWYPSLRLFRQRAPGDWTGVVAQVRQALQQRTSLR